MSLLLAGSVAVAVGVALPLADRWQLGLWRCGAWSGACSAATALILGPELRALRLPWPLQSGITGSLALAICAAVLAYRFYRDPERRGPSLTGAVVSPADGEILYIRRSAAGLLPIATKQGREYPLEELTRTRLKAREAVVIGIGMSFLDVHVNRSPIAGTVTLRRHFPGSFLSLREPAAPFLNERATTVIESGDLQVAVVQIASRLVRQIAGFVSEGQIVAAGERVGVIRLGSQVDLVLPARGDLNLAVQVGDRVRAGESILATVGPEADSPHTVTGAGAVVIGSDFRSLGVVRSLGRRGIRTLVIDNQPRAAWFSRFTGCRAHWRGPMTGDAFVEFLLATARTHGLQGWVLMPLQDEVVELVARQHERLSQVFRVVTPQWETARWALDKRLLNQLAESCEVGRPKSWENPGFGEVLFPAVLKPALSVALQQRFRLKAVAVYGRRHLTAVRRQMARDLPALEFTVQELIPGGGEAQLSVAVLCLDGRIVAAMTARRTRQYPVDFGLSSCFVEAVEIPDLMAPAARLIERLSLSGLAELEFKRDSRDGQPKLLDINLRPWGWHSLCSDCGLDFPYLQYRQALGEPVADVMPAYGRQWRRLLTDLLAAAELLRSRSLSVSAYLASFMRPTSPSVAALDDPLPAMWDLASVAARLLRERVLGKGQFASTMSDAQPPHAAGTSGALNVTVVGSAWAAPAMTPALSDSTPTSPVSKLLP